VYLGSDDAITVWLNGKQVLSHLIAHWCAPDQETVDLDLQAGENRLTIKITNGLLDAAFYFSLQPHTATADSLAPLWDQLIRDFPKAAQPIAWVRDDNLYGDEPAARFYRYDDPQVTLRGRWQYTIAGAPGGVARRVDQAGDEASLDFVGDSIALLHKEGRLERTLLLSREAEQLFGLVAVTVDGRPVEPGGPITRDTEGNAVLDTSRNAHVVLARGLTPGRHRLTVSNLGRPSHPGGSTAVAVLGFFAGVESGPTPWSLRAWRHALAVRGGRAWQEQAARLAAAANDEAGVKTVEQLYFASRELDAVAARLRALHDRPPPSALVERERKLWCPQPKTLAYFAQLGELKSHATAALAQADEFCYDPRQQGNRI
jgi:hypothetical protein